MNPRDEIYVSGSKEYRLVQKVAAVSVICLGLTILLVIASLGPWGPWLPYARYIILGLAAAWAILAPAWFFIEYFFLYRKAAAPDSWELFKHGQQVAIAIWAGVTAALFGLGSSEIAKPKEPSYACSPAPPATASSSQVLYLQCTRGQG